MRPREERPETIEARRVRDEVAAIMIPIDTPRENVEATRAALAELRRISASQAPRDVQSALQRVIFPIETDLGAHDARCVSVVSRRETEAAAAEFRRAVGRHTTTPF